MARKKVSFMLTIVSLALMVTAAAFAQEPATMTIESDVLSVEVDQAFPRVIKYTWKATGDCLHGQDTPLKHMRVNGEIEVPRDIKFTNTADSATYTVRLSGFRVTFQLQVVGPVLEFKVISVGDGGYHNLRTLGIPGHSLFSLRSDQPGSAIAAAHVKPQTLQTGDVFFNVADAAADPFEVSKTYIIGNTDKLAVAMSNNVLTDRNRMLYQTVDKGIYKQTAVWNSDWTYRQVESEIVELPYAKVIITTDRNADGKVDWQDGAIAYRDIMTSPLGSEDVKMNVISQIAMNFASFAQHPFLRVLDSIKMTYLQTDGLGQSIQFKGYQSEGHDSSHPDYGNNISKRCGGQGDLNFTVNKAKEFNTQCGVHVNVTEYYPEAKHYSNDKLTGKRGWAWLDQSIYADKRYDIISGSLYQRLDELKAAVPDLSFLYVDVYWGEGWDSWKLAKRMHEHGWACYTEFEGNWERSATWIHRSQKPAGLGVHSKIIRFIRNHQQDVWLHHDLLRGSYDLGFLGWHAENNLHAAFKNIFTNNLPTKYMQYFKITKWTDDRIDFDNGVYVAREDGKSNLYKDGKLIATGVYNAERGKKRVEDCKLFLPWDPIEETKIYHWNEAGGKTTWDIPNSWQGAKSVKLYKLTDIGRASIADIPVADGKVTISADADTPYVVYKDEPAAYPTIVWGDGHAVRDPGFDSRSFDYWTASSDNVTFSDDDRGQTHLAITASKETVVSQDMVGLQSGKTYSASVWVQITGDTTATLAVKAGDKEVSSTIRKTDVSNNSYCSDKAWTNYQRVRLFFEMPAGRTDATVYLKASKGDADAVVEFDDVRVVEAPKQDNSHYFFEDFEWTDEGWGPFSFAIQSDTHTHLSEKHLPYTNDTINGEYSLKTRDERQGLVYRTTEGMLRLQPNTTYTLSFAYLQDNDQQYSVIVATNDGGEEATKVNTKITGNKGTFKETFTTGAFDDYYIGIVKNTKDRGVMVMDDLTIDISDKK